MILIVCHGNLVGQSYLLYVHFVFPVLCFLFHIRFIRKQCGIIGSQGVDSAVGARSADFAKLLVEEGLSEETQEPIGSFSKPFQTDCKSILCYISVIKCYTS